MTGSRLRTPGKPTATALLTLIILACIQLVSAAAHTLTGRFVLDGERPEQKRLMTHGNQGLLPMKRSPNFTPQLVPMTTPDGKPVYDDSLRVGKFLVFRIENIPDGNREFSVWPERCGYIRTGTWPKGRFQLAFQTQATGATDDPRDLGVVKLGPEVFAKNTQSAISEEEFLKLHAQLQPDPKEPWRTIPWKISLLDAQRVAAETRKPLFIWAMDGHPLGCT